MFTSSPVTVKRIEAMLTSHVNTVREQGLKALPSIAADIAGKARRSLVSIDKYFLYEKDLTDGTDIGPIEFPIDNIEMIILFMPISIEEYEHLGEKGIDFRKHPQASAYRPGMGDGTIVFLGVRNDEIIYRSCISNYFNAVYAQICPAALDNGTICYQGFNWTSPRYRKKGLYTWGQKIMFDFMKSLGYRKILMLEPEDQIGPRKVQDRLGSKMLCISYAFRLLFLINYRWNRPALA